MNRNTIESILTKKFNSWLESITDENIRKLVKQNTIITGGAIVSLILNEKPKDYDIYFKNKNTVLEVAHYYANQVPQATVVNENDRIKVFIKSSGQYSETSEELSGEYFEGLPENEVNTIKEVMTEVNIPEKIDESEKKKYRPIYLTSNAITLSDKIQIVIRFFGEPNEIHKNYDFVHVTNYWESSTGKLTLQPAAMEAILAKELRYVGSLYPVASVIRTRKFLKRGWNINAGQYLKMMFQISELDLTKIETLEEQLIGVDTAYFNQLISALKEHKEKHSDFVLTAGYLATIIDKIF